MFATYTPWHGLGITVDGAKTSEEAIKLAQLDFEVRKQQIFIIGEGGRNIQIKDKYATVRQDTNTPLGVVGDRYAVMQNAKAFEFIDTLVGSKEAIFETAGALGEGERVFLTCKLPSKLVVGTNDVADMYFFLTNSHDGSGAIQIMFTPTFVVCENTVRMALSNGVRKQKVRHTVNFENKLFDAADLMGITRNQIEELETTFKRFTEVKITDPQLRKFIELAMGNGKEQIDGEEYSTRFTNTVDEVLNYALSDPAQLIEERKGNLWGAYNAITGFYNNVESYKSDEVKLKTILYGNGYIRGERAMNLALDVLSNNLILS